MKIDCHTHSKYSRDALTKPETMVKTAKKKGVGFAITDHNNVKAWNCLKELGKQYSIPIIFGEEVYSYNEEDKFAGEIIGLFLNEEIKSRYYMDIFDEIKEQDGLIVLPHPFDKFRKGFKFKEDKEVLRKINAVEVFNARCYLGRFNDSAKAYAEKNNLAVTAGSDGHIPKEIGAAYIEGNANDLEEFRRMILKKEVTPKGKLSGLGVHVWTQLANYKLVSER